MTYSKSSNRERGLIQNPAREREDLLKIQQQREKEFFKNQQQRERERERRQRVCVCVYMYSLKHSGSVLKG